jgi:hypothetical protein
VDASAVHAGERLDQERDTACCSRDGSSDGVSDIGRMVCVRSSGVNACCCTAARAYERGAHGPGDTAGFRKVYATGPRNSSGLFDGPPWAFYKTFVFG